MPFGRPITLTPNIATKTISSSATADQTSFTPSGGYRINEIGVYRNGVRLAQDRDFTAEDGVTVTLLSGCTAGDVVEFIIFDSFNIADAIVGAASSQNINGDVNVTGNLYAGTFHGTATGLTGTPDITIDGLTANDINVSGAATVTGIGTFGSDVYVDGDLNVTGDIVYDEVTGRNLNITGVATAAAIHVGTAQTFDGSGVNITGVVTATTFKGALSVDGSIAIKSDVDLDPDGDRIRGEYDKCPDQKENFNGFEDGDGCPDSPPEQREADNNQPDPAPNPNDADTIDKAEILYQFLIKYTGGNQQLLLSGGEIELTQQSLTGSEKLGGANQKINSIEMTPYLMFDESNKDWTLHQSDIVSSVTMNFMGTDVKIDTGRLTGAFKTSAQDVFNEGYGLSLGKTVLQKKIGPILGLISRCAMIVIPRFG